MPIGLQALAWIARYLTHAHDLLCTDRSERTLFLTVGGTPLKPDSLTEYGRRYIQAAALTFVGRNP